MTIEPLRPNMNPRSNASAASTPRGNEFWSSRDLAEILGYTNYRNFEQVIQKARTACFNSGHRIEDHFRRRRRMIEIGKGGQRAISTVLLSRYACYLIIQNADPRKEIIAAAKPISPPQTEEKLRRDKVQGKTAANRTISKSEKKVRQTIQELGGTMPEKLPPADSIKKLEAKHRKALPPSDSHT